MRSIRSIGSRGDACCLRTAVALLAVASSVGASAKPNQAAAKQGNVKAVAFFGFAAANSFAQATWAGVKQAAARQA